MLRLPAVLVLGLVAATALGVPASDDVAGLEGRGRAEAQPPTPRYAFSANDTVRPALSPDDIDRALSDLERRSTKLDAEFTEIDRAFREIHGKSVLRGRAYVRLARAGLLPIGDGFDAMMSHAVRLQRLRQGLARDGLRGRRLAERRQQIVKEIEDVRLRQGPLRVQTEAMALARDALRSSQERSLAFERAFLNHGPKTAHTAVYGAGLASTDQAESSEGFAGMKGRLPFPLSGRSEVQRVRRPGAGGMGLEMSAPRGAAVRAVYPGRVAFADTYAEYGRTVIVDHSQGYYTVSAALDQIEVRAGDDVRVGDRLGTVGGDLPGPERFSSDASSSAGVSPGAAASRQEARSYVYFEVRAGADVIDPNVWFGI